MGTQGGSRSPGSPTCRICFATDEIHPSTTGGCGVLLHHAAELLRQAGHTVVFLLDVSAAAFAQFRDTDRHELAGGEPPPAYHVDELCRDQPVRREDCQGSFQWTALRFDHALRKLVAREKVDLVEFIEYRGVGYYALVRKLFGLAYDECVLSVRLHNSMELIDSHEATKTLGLERYLLHGLERGALNLAETVIAPTPTYARVFAQGHYGISADRIVLSESPRRPFPAVDRSDPTVQREIVCFGRVYQFKGVDKLVQAALILFERRPELDVSFVFLGEDSRDTPVGRSHTEYLRRMIPDAWQHRFQFPGQLTHEESAGRLSRALFGVFPNEFESFCYALHELYHAGIPVVASDLPGFADFFRHEHNALLFDGSVEGLVAAMERMLDDASLRQRLSCPYPVATDPLGDFYDNPRACTASVAAEPPDVLLLILAASGTDPRATLSEIAAMEDSGPLEVLVLRESVRDEAGCVPFLGKLWRAENESGERMDAARIRSRDALWILEAGDRPDPSFLMRVSHALAAKPAMGFAGTWTRSEGRVQASVLDLAPELWPSLHGAERTRVVLRTRVGQPLADLFDARLGELGEIGLLWQAVDEHGPGCLLADPLLELASTTVEAVDPKLLAYLVLGQRDPERIRRLARLSAVHQQDATARDVSRKAVRRLAREHLDATTLWKLGFARLFSR